MVVRLKGGDPFVFGRGGEEAEALAQAGVPFEVVPGRDRRRRRAGLRRHSAHAPRRSRARSRSPPDTRPIDKDGGAVDWDALARGAATLVLYMSVTRLGDVVARLLAAGRAPTKPVAVIERGTMPRAAHHRRHARRHRRARAPRRRSQPPALTIVGDVVQLRERIAWFDRRPLFGRRILLLSTKDEAEAPRECEGADVMRVAPLVVVPRVAEVEAGDGAARTRCARSRSRRRTPSTRCGAR